MEIPENATKGTLYSYKKGSDEEPSSFVIYEKEENLMRVRWDKPGFYCISLPGGDYMSRYNNTEGVLTKRKNGKWMFQGHQRLYSWQEVKFS